MRIRQVCRIGILLLFVATVILAITGCEFGPLDSDPDGDGIQGFYQSGKPLPTPRPPGNVDDQRISS